MGEDVWVLVEDGKGGGVVRERKLRRGGEGGGLEDIRVELVAVGEAA